MSKHNMPGSSQIGWYAYTISYYRSVSPKKVRPELFADTSQFETSDDILAMDLIEVYGLILQSHLALIYRAIRSTRGDSPLHFCDECVTASRAAIEGYNAAWEKYQSREDTVWKSVINW